MLSILQTRRWVILTLVFFVLIPVMYWLGMWQFGRYQQTNSSNQVISSNLHAAPVPMESLSKPGATVPAGETYRTVSASGHYDQAHQFVIRQRTDASGDNIGFYVVTPLITPDGDAVLVNRGWVQAGNTTGNEFPTVPPAPAGTVTVTGRLRPDETATGSGIRDVKGLPPRQFMLISSAQQAGRQPEPVVSGYLELTRTVPTPSSADSAELVPGPNNTDSDSMAVVGKGVHLPYAIQWWLFALLVPLGWGSLLRREVRDRARKEVVAAKKAAFLASLAAKAKQSAASAPGAGSTDAGDTGETAADAAAISVGASGTGAAGDTPTEPLGTPAGVAGE